MEVYLIYVFKVGDEFSFVFEFFLGLFRFRELFEFLEDKYGIECCCLNIIMLFWVVKWLDEYGGDILKFEVVCIYLLKLC